MRCAVDYFLSSLAICVLTANALAVNNPAARMIVMVLFIDAINFISPPYRLTQVL